MKTILVGIDGSDHSAKALDLALSMAQAFDARLIIAHVAGTGAVSAAERHLAEVEYATDLAEPPAVSVAPTPETFRPHAAPVGGGKPSLTSDRAIRTVIGDHLLEDAGLRARSRGVSQISTVMREGDPVEELLDIAATEAVDTIVIGSRGLGRLSALLLGSVSSKIGRDAECSVLIVR